MVTLQLISRMQKTAGILGAINLKLPIFRRIIPPQSPNSNIHFAMAEEMNLQNHSPEVKEPTPEILKLGTENGLIQSATDAFFRVKKLSDKAVLPSRASSLSAGYDLSRYCSPSLFL